MEDNTKPAAKEAPATKEQVDSLKNRINITIDSYRDKRKRNKIGAISVQVLSLLFSFGTTVLIGWKIKSENPQDMAIQVSTLTNLALIASAFATGINALDKFFDYKALWVGYNVSIAQLKSLLVKLEYLSSFGQIKREKFDEAFDRYEMICANMTKNYLEIRSFKDE